MSTASMTVATHEDNSITVSAIGTTGHERTTTIQTVKCAAIVAEHVALILAVSDADAMVASIAETLGVSVADLPA